MNAKLLLTVITAAALAGPAGAQQRRATIVGGGNGDSGRCVAEVMVDGAAEVQIRGDMATLRDLSGRPPQWRRFECTGPIPANANVRFNASGRGGAALVAAPVNGGPAVVRIQDPEGGANVYQFELTWNNGGRVDGNQSYQGGYPPANDRRDGDRGQWQPRRVDPGQAFDACRDAIRHQAADRYRTGDINFRRIDKDGDSDRIVGMVEVRHDGVEDHLRFSCNVDLNDGRVRTARIEGPAMGSASRDIAAREMDMCRGAVSERVGSDRVEFGRMNINSANGDDLVTGEARVRGRSIGFTCAVSPDNGNVRNVDVRR
jgi:hypothetical protein